jgi:hypothetical protein
LAWMRGTRRRRARADQGAALHYLRGDARSRRILLGDVALLLGNRSA